jgi:two-component system, OmpR family, response regulator VicR
MDTYAYDDTPVAARMDTTARRPSPEHEAWASPTSGPLTPDGYHLRPWPSRTSEPGYLLQNWHDDTRSDGVAHVLVIDTDPQVLDIIGQLLSDEEYDATLTTRPLAASDVERLAPDVILADASLGSGEDGSSSLLPLSAITDVPSIPVVFSTMDLDTAQDLRDSGHPVLLKPFDLEDLLELIAQAVG